MNIPKTDTYLVELRRRPEQRTALLTWNDGAHAELTYDTIQGYCPCAHCRGHEGGEIVFLPPKRPIKSMAAAPVGNYAVALALEGGCNSGIFSFDFLREIARKEDLLQLGDSPS